MALDFSDAPTQRQDGVIPDGTFARVMLQIRPGGANLPNHPYESDARLFLQSTKSDVLMLDTEITVVSGPFRTRKFWQKWTVYGGQLNEKGISKGWLISKTDIRAMLESAQGLLPSDESAEAKAKRSLPGGFHDLDGIEFFAKIGIERGGDDGRGGSYPDKNRIAHIVTPNEPEYAILSGGGEVPPRPSSGGNGSVGASSKRAPAPTAAKPAWQQAAAPAAAPSQPAAAQAGQAGPAWLRG